MLTRLCHEDCCCFLSANLPISMNLLFKSLGIVCLVAVVTALSALPCVPVVQAQRLQLSPNNLYFERLTIKSKNPLSQSTVRCIIQDKRGFLWFGTDDGLNRWDGRTMKVYRYNPRDTFSLSSNFVTALYEDKSGTLWVGTQDGLQKFDPVRERFTSFRHDKANPNSLSNGYVTAIAEDNKRHLWVGTYNGGVNRFESGGQNGQGRFVRYQFDKNNPRSLSNDIVMNIVTDAAGTVWIGTYQGGLNRFDPERDSFTVFFSDSAAQRMRENTIEALNASKLGGLWIGRDGLGLERFEVLSLSKGSRSRLYTASPNNPRSLSISTIRSVLEDIKGRVWVGTTNGLNLFDPVLGTATVFHNNNDLPTSIGDETILCIYEDRSGTLWFGTENNGVTFVNPSASKFISYRNDPNNPKSLSDNTVWSFYQDRNNTMWIGTDNGLNRAEDATLSEQGSFAAFFAAPENPQALSNNSITSFCESRNGTVWIGTNGGGLCRAVRPFSMGLMEFRSYQPDKTRTDAINNEFVNALLEDRRGKLWVGTTRGISILENIDDAGEAHFTTLDQRDQSGRGLSNNVIMAFCEDRDGAVWVGTVDGLNKFDRTSQRFTAFKAKHNDTTTLSNNFILCICEDAQGTIWVGTQGGLNRYDRKTNTFTSYTVRDGLPNDFIYGILDDRKGHLWLSTNKGLCRFTPPPATSPNQHPTVRNYDYRDGLQSNEFTNGAYFRDRSGRMYFGGTDGFSAFQPENIKDNPVAPSIVFTTFRDSVEKPLDSAITEKRVIELRYAERDFTIGFAVLSFTFADKNQCQYILHGYDEENAWKKANDSYEVSYTNLDPGTYTFHVRASNYDGVWNNEGATLTIIIKPPFWQTWWFRMAIAAFVLTGAYIEYKRRIRVIQQRNRELEFLVDVRTQELREKTVALETTNADLSEANHQISRQNHVLEAQAEQLHYQAEQLTEQKKALEDSNEELSRAIEVQAEQAREIELANTELQEKNLALDTTLTELKTAQAQLVQSEKMASLGQLLAGVAHEINNPVNFVAGAIKPLRRNVQAVIAMFRQFAGIAPESLTPETLETTRTTLQDIHQECEDIELETMIGQTDDLLTSIGDGAQRISDIVKTLGNFSRSDAQEMKPTSVHEGIDSTLKLLYNQYKNRIAVVKEYGDVPPIVCYLGQLNQVFMNILVNAVHAIGKDRTDGEIRISTALEGNNVLVKIRDNGVGMTEEVKRKIFDPFFTTKDAGAGTGLGLSITFSVIEKHQGSISVESTPGVGTEFSIRLPIQPPSA